MGPRDKPEDDTRGEGWRVVSGRRWAMAFGSAELIVVVAVDGKLHVAFPADEDRLHAFFDRRRDKARGNENGKQRCSRHANLSTLENGQSSLF